MNNDIKEIIEQIKTAIYFKKMPISSDYHISIYDMEQLLDYITNLQEEMEILRSDYIGEKLKNDKAIEYIENEETYEEGYCDGRLMIYKDRLEYELLNILRGKYE